MDISDNIKKLRKSHGYTQRQLAEILKVKPTAISAWESGRNKPLMDKVTVMATLFKVSTSDIVGDTFKSDELLKTYKQLDADRQERVINYARLQLDQQRQPSNVKELYPDTLAAHADDIDHEYTPEELKHNIDFLDEQIDKYNRKHKK